MVKRLTDNSLTVDSIVWPGVKSGNPPGGPAVPASPRQAEPAPAKVAEPDPAESLELQRRVAEFDRLRQLESAEAHHKGVEDGLRRGREEAAAEVRKAFDQVARTLEELAQVKRKLRQEAEEELVKLSLAVARRILYRELSTDPSSIEGIVHAALQKLQQREVSRVRVFPAGVAAVRSALERSGSRSGLDVVPDPGLATGALLFETSVGELDASIDTQLQEIQRGFADRLAIR
jgi:flagellar assembly protein FliH